MADTFNPDFHEMERARRDFDDNEADKIASKIPPEISAMGGYLYEVPKRGTVDGAERLRAAHRVATNVERFQANEAAKVQAAKDFETAKAEEEKWTGIKNTLSIGLFEPLPHEFSRDELEKWARDIRADPSAGFKFAYEMKKRQGAQKPPS